MRLTQPKFEREIEILGSSLVKSVKYDPRLCILDATFKNGDRYRYREVYSSDFTALVTSKSAGEVFNKRIKTRPYGFERKATKLR